MIQETDNARAAYIRGLRELAAFMEAHPNLPTPTATAEMVYVGNKAALVAIAREPGVSWRKDAIGKGDYFSLTTRFAGGHGYQVFIDRDVVCQKTITGTRTIPAQPAQPERVVEDYTWTCGDSLLADGEVPA